MDYEYLKLKEKLNTDEGKRLYGRLEREYLNEYANQALTAIDYAQHKLIYQTGNRSEFEKIYFEKYI